MRTKPIPTPKGWQNLKPHPLSELVEFGAGIDLDAMAEHMREHGYDEDEAIILHEGMILDGRHRHPAAIKAGVTPTFRQFVGKNAMAYVAKKLFRQHLDTSQRAMMAATLTKLSPLAGVQNCTPPTLAEVAQTLNVSRRTVASAAKVLEEGTTALNQAVKDGTIKVGDAVKVAAQPPEVQNRAVDAVRGGLAGTASQAAGITPTRRTPSQAEREPGDDTEQIRTDRNAGKGKPRNGQPVINWGSYKSAIGTLMRLIRDMARLYGFTCKPDETQLGEMLYDFNDQFKTVYRKYTKKEPPYESLETYEKIEKQQVYGRNPANKTPPR
jgi:hypothetical protein